MAVQVRPTAPFLMSGIFFLFARNWVSRLTGLLVDHRWPLGLHRLIRDQFIRHFRVEVGESEKPVSEYPTLGAFFTRRLKSGSRPIEGCALVSPVDGTLTMRGPLADPGMNLIQIKGIQYSLSSLLGPDWNTGAYQGGWFMTLYLAPWNYHRIHVPAMGRVLRARHIPGFLWPVNKAAVKNIPGLFVRNDRILVELDCEGGRILVVMVGATNVGRTTLSFTPELRGNSGTTSVRDWKPAGDLPVAKGGELGCFEMGSTVILILDKGWATKLKPEIRGDDTLTVRVGMGFSV